MHHDAVAVSRAKSAGRRTSLGACIVLIATTLIMDRTQVEAATTNDYARFVGTYEATSLSEHAAIIDRAIIDGTEQMGPVRRRVGRRRLRAVNEAVRVVRISCEGSDVVTEFDGDRYVAPASGDSRRGRDPEGEPVNVSYRVSGNTIHGRYVGDDGEKQIDFVLDEAGLTTAVALLSDQLPAPIRYRLTYRRR